MSTYGKPVDIPEDDPQMAQHPSDVTHRPEETWGNSKKEKGAAKYARPREHKKKCHYLTRDDDDCQYTTGDETLKYCTVVSALS